MTRPPAPTRTDAAPTAAPDWLFAELTEARLLHPDRAERALAQFQKAQGYLADPDADPAEALARFLVDAGLLTPYQAERALAGAARQLVLGPYQLETPVGSGSLGTVFRAVHAQSRERFAVKVLPLRSLWNVIRARRQVQLLARLPPHPAVVPLVEVGTAAGAHYLAWPFAEGETVERLVARAGPLGPAQVASLMAQVADGLSVCHAQGIGHGLLKPSNLLIGPDRKARILDLGIGAILQENLADGESMLDTISTAHTAMTMMDCAAPETLIDPSERTAAGDFYSLGCILYWLLSGRYPFPDGNAVDKIIAHQGFDPVPVGHYNPAAPDSLVQLAGELMAKSPDDRPVDARLIRDRLTDAAARIAAEAQLHGSRVMLPPPLRELPPDPAGLSRLGSWVQSGFKPSPPATPPPGGLGKGASAEDSVNFDPAPYPPGAETPRGRPTRAQDSGRLDLYESEAESDAPGAAYLLPAPPAPRAPAWPGLPAEGSDPDSPSTASGNLADLPPPPNFGTLSGWRRLARRVFTWIPPHDVIQLSLFGPAELAPGRTHRFQVYAHPPEAFASVRTLSRAFQPDTELRAAGYATRLIPRGSPLGLHLAVAQSAVPGSLVTFKWVGHTKPHSFEVYVPWESRAGRTPGRLTLGLNAEQVAEVEFEVLVQHRAG